MVLRMLIIACYNLLIVELASAIYPDAFDSVAAGLRSSLR